MTMEMPDERAEIAAANHVGVQIRELLQPGEDLVQLRADGFGRALQVRVVAQPDAVSVGGREVEVSASLVQDVMSMRCASYRHGRGAWFVVHLVVREDVGREVLLRTDRVGEPGCAYDIDEVRFDLGWFPRDPDQRPDWFAAQLGRRDPARLMDERSAGMDHTQVLREEPISRTFLLDPQQPQPKPFGPFGKGPESW